MNRKPRIPITPTNTTPATNLLRADLGTNRKCNVSNTNKNPNNPRIPPDAPTLGALGKNAAVAHPPTNAESKNTSTICGQPAKTSTRWPK